MFFHIFKIFSNVYQHISQFYIQLKNQFEVALYVLLIIALSAF